MFGLISMVFGVESLVSRITSLVFGVTEFGVRIDWFCIWGKSLRDKFGLWSYQFGI